MLVLLLLLEGIHLQSVKLLLKHLRGEHLLTILLRCHALCYLALTVNVICYKRLRRLTSCIVDRLFSILDSLILLILLLVLLRHLVVIELLLLLFLLLLGCNDLLLSLDELLDDGDVDVWRGTSRRVGLDQLLLNASEDAFHVHRRLNHTRVCICHVTCSNHSLNLLLLLIDYW